jgi:radical SAM protein with 4Fe4S-binding SPASM domain
MSSFTETTRHGRDRISTESDTFLAEHGWARSPRLVQWMLTWECPLRCPHCLADESAAVAPNLSWKEMVSVVDQVAGLKVQELLLTGGEPLARPDLPKILELLRAHKLRWSLNTAVMPDANQQAAIEKWPPIFVAVSLDGPPKIHDRFRGSPGAFARAMSSIRYFSELVPSQVAAGTTVTASNFNSLPETFGLVLESGASSWGLHLLVPEGRAAHRPKLRLSRRQIRQLLAFAAARRNHFRVSMADEIGYCGYWEPLVRETPFYCGAGKLQCVVRPDGEVVPCNTVDPATSAGNIRSRRLRDIWDNGFSEMRRWSPARRCAQCAYAPACEGGCWLQRRHGTECYRDVWHMPQALTKAGMAVCLGLAAVAPSIQSSPAGTSMSARDALQHRITPEIELLQRTIIQWYVVESGEKSGMPTRSQLESRLQTELKDDPGAQFFLRYIKGETPKSFERLAVDIEAALKTRQRSLCLISLIWRTITEQCLDGVPPAERTRAEQAALHRALTMLENSAMEWRKEIFEKKLDPFLQQPDVYHHFLESKGRAANLPDVKLEATLARKQGWYAPNITASFLNAHPYAESINLELIGAPERTILREGRRLAEPGIIGIFDLISPQTNPIVLTLKNVAPKTGGVVATKKDSVVAIKIPERAGLTVDVKLPVGVELAYGDLLRLAYEQNKEKLNDAFLHAAITSADPSVLLLPAMREKLRNWKGALPWPAQSVGRESIQRQLFNLYFF